MKQLLLTILCVFAVLSEAQDVKSVKRNYQKSIKKYKHYHATFDLLHKPYSQKDTFKSSYNISLTTLAGHLFFGKGSVRNSHFYEYTAFQSNENVRFYIHDSSYYRTIEPGDVYTTNSNYTYPPLSFRESYIKDFTLDTTIDNKYYTLLIDSYFYDQYNDTYNYKECIHLDKSSYIPQKYEKWVWFDYGVTYDCYQLTSLTTQDNSMKFYKDVLDDMNRYKTFTNGDSLQRARYLNNGKIKDKLKTGDTIASLYGAMPGTQDSFDLIGFKDSIIILDFAYTSCGPCVKSLPALKSIYRDFNGKGVLLYSVNPISNDWHNIDTFVKHFKINFPIVKIDKRYIDSFGILGYPTIFILYNGKLSFIHHSYHVDLEAILREEIQRIKSW